VTVYAEILSGTSRRSQERAERSQRYGYEGHVPKQNGIYGERERSSSEEVSKLEIDSTRRNLSGIIKNSVKNTRIKNIYHRNPI
jgi:hypothetical protein